jgi:hypothetical protein
MFTNQVRTDGFGAQYQCLICTIIYSVINNSEFIYSKPDFETVYQDESKFLCEIINLENSFRNFSTLSDEEKDKVNILDIKNAYDFFEYNIDYCLKSEGMKIIRNLYTEKNPNQYNTIYTNVAIHIRRCSQHKNIDLDSHHYNINIKNTPVDLLPSVSERFLPDKYYLNIIEEIKSNHVGNPLKFYIFSEGKDEDFLNFNDKSIELRLNESIKNTFSGLVHADILVTSASSFSYVAALLSTNIIYAKSFWHKNASHWLTR